MVTIDKSGEETFTLIETAKAVPPPPEIYTQTRENYLAYRKKVMTELVGGRVNDLIFAGHNSLEKYKAQLANLNVSAYLFKNLRRHAMALQFKGKNVGNGMYRSIASSFLAPTTMYPLEPPYNVPQRLLPQVDVFQFTPTTDIEYAEKTGITQWKTLVNIQLVSGTAKETPDMENALYDFYFFYPQAKFRGRWLFVSPFYPNWTAWNSEYTLFVREMRVANTHVCFLYYVLVWVDNDVETTIIETPRIGNPIFVWLDTYRRENDTFFKPSNAPITEITIIGRRLRSDFTELFSTGSFLTSMTGFVKVATGFTIDTVEATWYNTWKITLSVNNVAYGTIDPPPDTYTKQAMDGFWVTAKPIDPHVFDHWEQDGVNIGNVNPYYVYPLKDSEVRAVFV